MRRFSVISSSAVLALALGAAVLLPQAASAASFGPPGPIQTATDTGSAYHYDITAQNYGLVGHNCAAHADPYKGVSAIVCADTYALAVPSTTDVKVYSMLEGYCQGSGSLPECTQVDADFTGYIDGKAQREQYQTCGVHTGSGSCLSNGRNYFYVLDTTLGAVGDCHTFQTWVGDTGNDGDTGIELPGDVWQWFPGEWPAPAAQAATICDEM